MAYTATLLNPLTEDGTFTTIFGAGSPVGSFISYNGAVPVPEPSTASLLMLSLIAFLLLKISFAPPSKRFGDKISPPAEALDPAASTARVVIDFLDGFTKMKPYV